MSRACHPLFPLAPDSTPYRKLSGDGVRIEHALGADMLVVDDKGSDFFKELSLG